MVVVSINIQSNYLAKLLSNAPTSSEVWNNSLKMSQCRPNQACIIFIDL